METILKKLDLEYILEKEMNMWYQTSAINLSNASIDEISTSNVLPKMSNNNLTNKISETIQNIKIKKQKDLYVSQIPNKEIKKPTTNSSKVTKICDKVLKQNDIEEVLNVESNEKDIFVNRSKKNINNISFKSLTSMKPSLTSSSSDISNGSSIKENNDVLHKPSHTPIDIGQLARLKLNAFKCNKKSKSSSNSGQVEKNTDKLSSIKKQPNFSNIFSTEDEDDLSYLDID